jgi:hypothetical protein
MILAFIAGIYFLCAAVYGYKATTLIFLLDAVLAAFIGGGVCLAFPLKNKT